jgi:TolB-like protein/class 3 adenylate cyclase
MDRRLAAILAADVVGYSRLMGEDEAGTLTALKAHRAEFFDPKIAEHRGRIVKLMGDGVLIEFASVVDALECAVAIQRGMPGRNAEVPEDRQIVFRIGLNLGDIIIDGDDIYGNGVNVAARLEALAEPDGICISGRVLDQVEKNVEVGFAFLGPQTVKNIDRPVNAYKVLLDPEAAGTIVDAPKAKVPGRRWLVAAIVAVVVVAGGAGLWVYQTRPDFEPASVAKMAYPLPEKPSIAVLPFDNLSGEKEQDPIADGLIEAIITALSRDPDLFVIARNSVLTYKGKPVKVQQVAEDLGVRYVLEGSVQRSGDRLRVTAQLVDALDGSHLWANRYDRPTENFFALQDDITREVLIELQGELTFGEHARGSRRETNSLEAWLLRNQALAEGLAFSREGTLKARDLYEQALEADPEFARAWAGIAWTYWTEARMGGWQLSRDEALTKASEFAERAMEIDPQSPAGYLPTASVALMKNEHDRAVALVEQAVDLAPNDFQANASLGWLLVWAGEPKRALEMIARAKRLSPRYPAWILGMEGLAQHMLGRHEDAIVTLNEDIRRLPRGPFARPRLIAVYADLDRLEEARAAAAELLKLNPEFSVKNYVKAQPFKAPERKEWMRDLLLKAGLPE